MPTQEERATAVAEAVAQLRARIEQRRAEAWQPEPGPTAQERRRHWQEVAAGQVKKTDAAECIGDAAMNKLAREFLKAAERNNAPLVGAWLEEGFPANWQDRQTEETALHISAAARARGVLRVLVESGLCDYLLRDKGGRLASELAYLFGRDPAAARLLGIKERKQAEAQGITLTRKPKT